MNKKKSEIDYPISFPSIEHQIRRPLAMGSAAGTPAVLLRFLQLGVFLALGVAALGPAAQGSRVHHYQFLVSILHFCWRFRPSGSVRSVLLG
jgi:hypothetical protein